MSDAENETFGSEANAQAMRGTPLRGRNLHEESSSGSTPDKGGNLIDGEKTDGDRQTKTKIKQMQRAGIPHICAREAI